MSEHVKVSELKRMSAMIQDWLKARSPYTARCSCFRSTRCCPTSRPSRSFRILCRVCWSRS